MITTGHKYTLRHIILIKKMMFELTFKVIKGTNRLNGAI